MSSLSVPVDEVVVVAWFGVDGGRAEVESGLKVEEDEGVEEEEVCINCVGSLLNGRRSLRRSLLLLS